MYHGGSRILSARSQFCSGTVGLSNDRHLVVSQVAHSNYRFGQFEMPEAFAPHTQRDGERVCDATR